MVVRYIHSVISNAGLAMTENGSTYYTTNNDLPDCGLMIKVKATSERDDKLKPSFVFRVESSYIVG